MIWVGTSGYNYPEWKGSFYPETLSAAKMLPYYAERLATVEINYTYYRTPNQKILAGWNAATPERFKLTLKAPKRITHEARNRTQKSAMRTAIKALRAAIEAKNVEQARALLQPAVRLVDRIGRRGVVKPRAASRAVSRMTLAVNRMSK